jgi:hypothetical protein
MRGPRDVELSVRFATAEQSTYCELLYLSISSTMHTRESANVSEEHLLGYPLRAAVRFHFAYDVRFCDFSVASN